MQSILKALLKIMREYGYDMFASGYGFASTSQRNILMNGFENHICIEWVVDVCRPLITDAFISIWLDTNPSNDGDIYAFFDWLRDARSDVHFDNHAYLAFDMFAAFALYIKGQRNNDYAAYNGGRKTLLPLLFILEHKYADPVMRDIYEYEYKCSEEVRLDRKRHFTQGTSALNNQGWDFRMEETVKRQKSLVTADNETGFAVAAQMCQDRDTLLTTLSTESGRMGNPIRERRDRTKTNLTMTMEACQIIMDNCMHSLVKQEGRNVVKTLDGKHVNFTGTELKSMVEDTKGSMILYERSGMSDKKVFHKHTLRSMQKDANAAHVPTTTESITAIIEEQENMDIDILSDELT